MLVDLSRLNGVSVDAAARTATAQPAIKNTEDGRRARAARARLSRWSLPDRRDRWLPAGWRTRLESGTWGIACKNVLAIDLVNADGELITADGQQNSDLLWAARGGGPGFPGIILRYHLRLFPRPKSIAQSIYVYPLELLEPVVKWLSETVPSLAS